MAQRFNFLEDIIVSVAEAVRPPEPLTVVEAAEKYVKLNNPGAYTGPFKIDKVPYLAEPMEALTSEDHKAVIFVGPSQCAKSTTGEMWLAHTAKCDPADMLIVNMNKEEARDFKIRRVDRLFRYSPEINATKIEGRNNDNTFDVKFKSGALLTLRGPTVAALSGKPIPRVWLNDYDRMPQDIDGEGSGFGLASARITTFGRNGMVLAEASPGFEIDDPKWKEKIKSKHEGPPATGIVGLYNQGDRRRWYWRCPSCSESFEPSREHLRWANSDDIMECANSVYMMCPHCGHIIHENGDKFGPGKQELNRKGRWLRDGQRWLSDGSVVGEGLQSDFASFWLFGVAAAFSTWSTLVSKFLKAEEEYGKNGDATNLKSALNTGFGEVYCSKSAASSRLPEDLKARARDGGDRIVPENVRFLIATVDTQKNRFEVQIHGIESNGDIHIIDRFPIKKSKRYDADGERYPISPANYLDDWKILYDEVMKKSYFLGDGSGRKMGIHHTSVDSQGEDGVTPKAYEFWRWLRTSSDVAVGMEMKLSLTRGTSNQKAPRVVTIYPDSTDKNRKHVLARGDIPVLQINTNMVKDMLDARLNKTDFGEGFIHFPKWLPDWFFQELTAEVKTTKGWENPKRVRNEAWDLLVYTLAICLTPKVDIERIDWENPPDWAKDWNENSLVFDENEESPFTNTTAIDYDEAFAQLAEDMG